MKNFETIYIFLWIFCVVTTNCRGNFFMAKKYENYDYRCITNTTSALSWITEESVSNSVSEFIPQKLLNYFDCEIKSDDYRTETYFLNHPWTLKSSLNGKNSDVILDRRWEDMKLYTTDYVEGRYEQLKFQIVLSKLKNNFKIPLSILIEKEAHIFLCDGDNPGDSNCYWFLLQAWKETATALRKCGKRQIPVKNSKWAQYPCNISLVNISHPEFPKYLSKRKWNHFFLAKELNHLTFSQNGKNKKIIDFHDNNGSVINVTHMIVHSKMVKGHWKMHEIEYIYTNEETKKINLGPPIDASENFVCISMFVSMCSSCKLKLGLFMKFSSTILEEKIYETTHSGWTEIKFIAENLLYERKSLLISTEGKSQDRFWAIDQVKFCQKDEFRMISITAGRYNVPTCQLMSDENSIISFSKEPEDIEENHCPENTIGKFCVPCQWVFAKCYQVKICELDLTKEMCYCGAGYDKLSDCYYECVGGTYGHGCKKKCGKCKGSWPFKYPYCNKADGTCSSGCSDDYRGPRCDIPPGLYFVKPPEILNVTYTSATIGVHNFEINEGRSTDSPLYYRAQYKKNDYSDSWIYVGIYHNFSESSEIKITELETDTEYLVRCVILTQNNQTYISDDIIPTQKFKTKCHDITENNIDVVPSNTSVEIILVNTNSLTCKNNSKDRINIIFNKYQSRLENSIFYNDLTPYTEYSIIISTASREYEKKFRTSEGVPAKVKNIKVINTTSSSVTLTWDKPEINGELENYIVNYQFKARVGCRNITNSPLKTMTVSNNFTTIKDLIPYSKYLITVVAKNAKFKGKDSTIEESTLPSSTIQADEIPNIEQITPNFNSAAINLSPIECSKAFGPRLIKVKITCKSEWCENKTQEILMETSNHILLKNLMSFSNYDVEIKFCRSKDEMTCYKEKKYTFKTKPTAPNEVKDLLVTSKSRNSVSLRWKPPYPPNGILTQYIISYECTSTSCRTNTITLNSTHVSCRLWQEFHCIKITNLRENYKYIIKVEAQNEVPQNLGQPNTISATTQIEQSEAPNGFEIIWTVENDLLLNWKHPHQTNGDLHFFHIEISPENEPQSKSVKKNISLTENDYNLTYHFKVKQNELSSSTRYKVSIYADNGLKGKIVSKIITSPPSIPSLAKEPFVSKTCKTITLNITVKGLKPRDNCSLFVLVYNENYEKDEHIEFNNFKKKFSKVKIVHKEFNLFNKSILFVIGNRSLNNPPLNPGTTYGVTFLLINEYGNKTRYKIESFTYSTVYEPQDLSLLGLLVLLLLIPIVAIIFMKKCKKNKGIKENTCGNSEPNNFKNNQNLKKDLNRGEEKSNENNLEVFSRPVLIDNFKSYVEDCLKTGELRQQYDLIFRKRTESIYDTVDTNQYFDYIDIKFIDGEEILKAYVAIEMPEPNAVENFWKIIWEEHIEHTVLLHIYDNEGEKEINYWPENNETSQFNDILVQHIFTKITEHYELRMFTLNYDEEIRNVDQLLLRRQRNPGTELYSADLLPFFQKILRYPLSTKSPILVHCSGGIEGTCFVILCDMCLRISKKNDQVDVLKNFQRLVKSNKKMVKNFDYYKLAHLIILDYHFGIEKIRNLIDLYANV